MKSANKKIIGKKGISMLSVVLGVVLLLVLAIIVYKTILQPSKGVFECSTMQSAVCDFKQCPEGYTEIIHLTCAGDKKGNSCCVPEGS